MGLSELLGTTIQEDSSVEIKKRDSQARTLIALTLSDSLLILTSGHNTTKELWDSLQHRCNSRDISRRISLLREQATIQMDSGSSLSQHLVALKTLFDKLIASGETVSEASRCMTLLRSLPSQFSHIVTVIESTTTNLEYEGIVQKLLNEEGKQQTERINTSSTQNALFTIQNKKRPRYEPNLCSYCQKPNHNYNQCRKRIRQSN